MPCWTCSRRESSRHYGDPTGTSGSLGVLWIGVLRKPIQSRERSHLETRKGITMNSIFRISAICLVSTMLFTFPHLVQSNDWLQPSIARAVSTSMNSGNVEQLLESSSNAYLGSDNSNQAAQEPSSIIIDGSETTLIIHGCAEAAAVCP